MDLKQSIKPIVEYWWLVGVTIVIALMGIVIFNKMQTPTYDGAVTLMVKQTLPASEAGDDYKYNGYYAVMANQTFADTLESWLDSPEIVAEIYERAGFDVPQSISFLASRFSIDKVISQSVSVGISVGSEEEAESLLDAMNEVLKQRVESMLVNNQSQPVFTLSSSKKLVVLHEYDYRLQFGIGVVGALALGLFLSYFVYAMKGD